MNLDNTSCIFRMSYLGPTKIEKRKICIFQKFKDISGALFLRFIYMNTKENIGVKYQSLVQITQENPFT